MADVEIFYNHNLLQLSGNLIKGSENAQDEIGQIYETEVKGRLEDVGAVDSRNYVDHVRARDAYIAAPYRIIEISAPEAETYSDIVESGKDSGAHVSYPGRYPVAQAINTADPKVLSVLDRMAAEIL